MRNKFISDYILQVTGKHRTPKQVGSRLQQLRDTCEGKRSECTRRAIDRHPLTARSRSPQAPVAPPGRAAIAQRRALDP